MKLKFVFSYDGSAFLGSAKQPHKKSVQDSFENALSHLGIYNSFLMASRTDKGVHANNAVGCVECEDYFKDLHYLKNQLNKYTHPFIHIKQIQKMEQDFEVRFDVKAREYRYVFNHDKFNPFLSRYTYFYPSFDINQANELLALFNGEHNFKLFQKEGSSTKSTIRKMYFAKAYAYKKLSIFTFRANGFLRAQIRLSVASVLAVLENRLSKEQLKEQIEAKKEHCRILAPPNGLYLHRILY